MSDRPTILKIGKFLALPLILLAAIIITACYAIHSAIEVVYYFYTDDPDGGHDVWANNDLPVRANNDSPPTIASPPAGGPHV